MTVRISGVPCSCGCGRPARELGNLATACWMGLTARARALLRWEHESQPTEPIDTLELAWALATRDHPPLAA